MFEQQIPSGWEWRKLGDLCKTTSGGTPSRRRTEYFQGTIPWVKSGELPDGEVTNVEEYITEDAIQNSSAKIFPKGTLLIALYGATVGKLGILGMDASTNQAVCAIFQPSFIERDFLFWYLKAIRKQLIEISFGGAQPNISQTVIQNTIFPLPFPDEPEQSLEVQRRIVARIEALLAEVREMRALQEEIAADTKKFMAAVLAEIFPSLERPLPQGWSSKKVKDIAFQPQYGLSQSAKSEPVGPKFLRITDIQNGIVNWNSVPYCECDPTRLENYQLKKGDIVFARSGATTGKTYLLQDPPEEAVFASYLIRLKLKEQLPEYVYWFFQSPGYWRQVTPIGAAIPNMNATLLKEVKLPFPSTENEQQQIVAYLDSVKQEIEEMRLLNEADAKYLIELEQSVLAQAFRGEL